MARKMNSSKFGPGTIGNESRQRVESPVAALYLAQTRTPALRISSPRQRLAVEIEPPAENPQPVKIIHVG
ncbi:MAG TPA: hypothetical protein VMB22_07410 [Verrucomicrobiae bacterium]|nr:hypothetical protein [Verrucomicrobiae bacterium]